MPSWLLPGAVKGLPRWKSSRHEAHQYSMTRSLSLWPLSSPIQEPILLLSSRSWNLAVRRHVFRLSLPLIPPPFLFLPLLFVWYRMQSLNLNLLFGVEHYCLPTLCINVETVETFFPKAMEALLSKLSLARPVPLA